jgi:hypothetical protein
MKPRDKALHADIEKLVTLKLASESVKAIATRHHVTTGYVRQLISAGMRHKRTLVMIHVERSDAKIAHRSEDSCESLHSLP